MISTKEFDSVKLDYLTKVTQTLTSNGDEVLRVKDGEIALPVVGAEGNDGFLVIKFVVPKGSRDGEEYDGYSERDAYEMTLKKRADKAEEKAKKIAADAKKRAESKEDKAE